MLEISGSNAASEDRIAALEKKMKEMEALVKGLTQELLDIKSLAMKMSKQSEERSRQELRKVPSAAQAPPAQPAAPAASSGSGSTVVVRKGAKADAPAKPEEPAMDMIMQPDGTMKLEPRRGDKDAIVASAGYGRKKGASGKTKQSEVIYAAEEEKSDPAKK
jgi:hypothetical protein